MSTMATMATMQIPDTLFIMLCFTFTIITNSKTIVELLFDKLFIAF